jgi:hypothetical protein
MQMYRVNFFLTILLFLTCVSNSSKVANMSEEEIIKDLTSRPYRFFSQTIDYKTKEKVPAIEMSGKGIYKYDDLSRVCSIDKLKFLVIAWGSLPAFSKDEIEACRNSNLNAIIIRGIKLENKNICQIAKGLKADKIRVTYESTEMTDSEFECFSEAIMLDSFSLDDYAKITDDGMCKFTENAKNLTFLRMDDMTNLTKRSLDCMLNLPSLNMVMLQRWKKVPESQMEKFVAAYEAKYKRKIQASIYDPTSYEKP